jgi:hypothetical protein
MDEKAIFILAVWLGIILPLIFVSAVLLTAYQ